MVARRSQVSVTPNSSYILLTRLFRQVWSAAKSASRLKQCMLYLVAYFMLQESEYCYVIYTMHDWANSSEAFGTYFNVTGLLQNECVPVSE